MTTLPLLTPLSPTQTSPTLLPPAQTAPTQTSPTQVSLSAAMIAIGDELLSGRTRDSNIAYAAKRLTQIGIDLKEVRIIADEEAAIIAAVNELRSRHRYLITCGGIGATHDDITAESIARALALPCIIDERAQAVLAHYYQTRDLPFTASRRLMARMPQGSQLIDNPISGAPGFQIGNIYVLAGVPAIFEAMLENLLPTFEHNKPMLSQVIDCPLPEGMIAVDLAEIQTNHPVTQIGSYPQFDSSRKGGFKLELVVRSREEGALHAAVQAIHAMIARHESLSGKEARNGS